MFTSDRHTDMSHQGEPQSVTSSQVVDWSIDIKYSIDLKILWHSGQWWWRTRLSIPPSRNQDAANKEAHVWLMKTQQQYEKKWLHDHSIILIDIMGKRNNVRHKVLAEIRHEPMCSLTSTMSQ